MSWLRSKSPQGPALKRMQQFRQMQLNQARLEPSKSELQDLLAEAVRNTAKLSTSSTTGEHDASDH